MLLIQPWQTHIGKVNLADKVNLVELSEEIFTLHNINHRGSETVHPVTPDLFPTICKLRDSEIVPLVQQYAKEAMNFSLNEFTIDTFGKWFEQGTDLGPHNHGNSGITTVFYPADYESGMSVYDPRGNACRGYPRAVRDDYFSPYHVYPKAGDLFIMPSFLEHYVPTVKDELRLSLINDFMFTKI